MTDVVVIARGDLAFDARVQKEVRSFAAAGYEARAVGIATANCDAGVEQREWGTVELVETRLHPPTSDRPADVATAAARRKNAYAGPLGALRHWAGRMRENRIVAEAVERLHPRVVVACDLDMLFAGWLVKRRTGARLVYDSHELWVDSHGGASAVFRFLYSTTERVLVRRADRVVTVNDLLAGVLSRRYRIRSPLVVMNGPDVSRPSGPSGSPLRLLFQGGFGHNRGLSALIDAMREVRGSATLALQGFGGIEGELRARVADNDLGDVVSFIKPVSPSDTVAAASGHDVGIISYAPSTLNLEYASPVKMFDYLGAGLAIISTDLPGVRAVAGTDAALYVPVPDAAGLAGAILELAADPERVARMKAAAAELGPTLLWDVQMRPLLDVVAEWTLVPEAVLP